MCHSCAGSQPCMVMSHADMCALHAATFELGQSPTTKESQAVGDELFSDFVSKEVDKVELIYTKFVSLIASKPTVQTLLPLTPQARPAGPSCPSCHFPLTVCTTSCWCLGQFGHLGSDVHCRMAAGPGEAEWWRRLLAQHAPSLHCLAWGCVCTGLLACANTPAAGAGA